MRHTKAVAELPPELLTVIRLVGELRSEPNNKFLAIYIPGDAHICSSFTGGPLDGQCVRCGYAIHPPVPPKCPNCFIRFTNDSQS